MIDSCSANVSYRAMACCTLAAVQDTQKGGKKGSGKQTPNFARLMTRLGISRLLWFGVYRHSVGKGWLLF